MLCLNSEIDLISKQILKNTTETKFIYYFIFYFYRDLQLDPWTGYLDMGGPTNSNHRWQIACIPDWN